MSKMDWIIGNGNLDKGAKKRVSAILKRYGIIRNFKILDNLNIEIGDRKAYIDHILIGFFGMLFIKTISEPGDYYGEIKSSHWSLMNKTGKISIVNPLEQGIRDMEVIRNIFFKNDIYNISIESIVVFTDTSKKTNIYVSNNGSIFTINKLAAYLNKTKFDKDTDIDVDKLAKAILTFNKS